VRLGAAITYGTLTTLLCQIPQYTLLIFEVSREREGYLREVFPERKSCPEVREGCKRLEQRLKTS